MACSLGCPAHFLFHAEGAELKREDAENCKEVLCVLSLLLCVLCVKMLFAVESCPRERTVIDLNRKHLYIL